MSDEYEFDDVTTDAAVEVYEASTPIFKGLLKEIRELSRKKPDATMNAGKVKIVNRVLDDLLGILKVEPTGKYLELLSDESLPQVSDAVLTMVQFESALEAFESKYRKYIDHEQHWITQETLDAWNAEEESEEEEENGKK